MFALIQVGTFAERLFGNWFFLSIYLACGLIASMSSVWWNHSAISAGASGAVFGIYGALLGYLLREREGLSRKIASPLAIGALVFVGWNLFYGISMSVSHSLVQSLSSIHDIQTSNKGGQVIDQAAHVGGLFSGLFLGFVAARPLELDRRKASAIGQCAALALSIGFFVALIPSLSPTKPDNAALAGLGGMYFHGEGVYKNPQKAREWFKRAADQGDLNSQKILGTIYLTGQDVATNIDEAIAWFTKAGEQGDLGVQKLLASIYYNGELVEKNIEEGARWMAMAAEQGDLQAAKALVSIYYRGDRVGKDADQFVKWLQKAAELGDPTSQSALATMYYKGEALPMDKSQAVQWYRKAANQGDPFCRTMMGLMYMNGEGIALDKVEALKWLILSGNQSEGRRARQALEGELTPAQKQEANQRAQHFRSVRGG
jgi:TPR repeat protein